MDIVRVLIVDDHPVVRDGISMMLSREKDFQVVGEAMNGLEAVAKAQELSPDVILMDLRMPEMDGVEAMRQITELRLGARFIVLTTFDTDEYIFHAIEAGAKSYLLKDSSREDLFNAVRAAYRGESLIQPSVASRALDRFAQISKQTGHGGPSDILSERELEVLRLMATGAANKQIAASLSVSESTAKTHVANIFQKLGVNDRTGAVTLAVQRGIIKL